MAQGDKQKINWLAEVSSDEDEVDVQEETVQQEAKKEVIQEKKEKKPQATPWNEAEHARNRYKKKVKGGFKAELAQKKVVHLKTSRNPYDAIDDVQEEESSDSSNSSDEEAQKETQELVIPRVEGESEEEYKKRVEEFLLKEKERIEGEAEEQRKLDEAVAKANKINEERAKAKAAKKEKKKNQEEEDIDSLLKSIETSNAPTEKEPKQAKEQVKQPTGQNPDKKKKKNKPKAEPQVKEQAPSAPVQEQILSIEQVLKRKAAKEAANKNTKKKADLGAAKREIEERKQKQKVKRGDLDL